MYFKALVMSIANKKWKRLVLIHSRDTTTFRDTFYRFARQAGINIVADIKIPDEAVTEGRSLRPYLEELKNTGYRVVLTNVRGQMAQKLFTEFVDIGVDASHGYQWVGTENTLESLDLLSLPLPHVHLAGAQFLSPMYGLGRAAQAFHSTTFSDFLIRREMGGMDPFWVKDLDFDISKMNLWTFSKVVLALDIVWFTAFDNVAMIDFGVTSSVNYCSGLYQWIFNLALHSGSAINFNSNLDRIGFTGVWAQLTNRHLHDLRQEQNAEGREFDPWMITTTINMRTNDADVIESRFVDPRTLERSDWPSYGPNVVLTRRIFIAGTEAGTQMMLNNVTDMVPVTHVCRFGCGGKLVNASNSAYEYEHGTCIRPDECECILSSDDSRPAFIGERCEMPNCLQSCRNGNCQVVNGDPICVCEPGWDGETCNIALCQMHGCFAGQGLCTLPDTCVCQSGYYLPDCSATCSCLNNATCNDGNTGSGTCTCISGFWGNRCEHTCSCKHGVCNDGTTGTGRCSSCDSGWMGPDCDLPMAAVAVPAAVGAGIGIALIVFCFRWYLRRARRRALLANMDWKVSWDDVKLHTADMEVSQKLESTMFQSTMSTQQIGQPGWRAAERLGKFKGQFVYIVRLNKHTIELSNEVRAEIRDIREVHNSNLLRFVGACTDSPNVAVLYEYAQKGSLEDIISNLDVNLDDNFKYHILKEISSGMKFLHSSIFKAHGRLQTATCFVDNRWTVKIGGMMTRIIVLTKTSSNFY